MEKNSPTDLIDGMAVHRGLSPVGVKTAVALGYFDGVHLGHREIFSHVAAYANKHALSPTVFTFDFSERRPGEKGEKDLFSLESRLREFAACGIERTVIADFTSLFGLSAEAFVRDVLGHGCLNAAMIACGEDYRFGKNRTGDVRTLQKLAGPYGIQVDAVRSVIDEGIVSTTRIKRLVREGKMEAAEHLLGRAYRLEGMPVLQEDMLHGHLLFRTSISPRYVEPPEGVYLSCLVKNDARYPAITTVVGDDENKTAQTVLLAESVDGINGNPALSVELCSLWRGKQEYASPAEEEEATLQDIERARMLV